jgi:prodigiosin/undecylprodigiosin synthetase
MSGEATADVGTSQAPMRPLSVPAPESAAAWIIPLESAEPAQLPALGGKGRRLAEMAQNGFPVPPGFCVTTAAFGAFLDHAGLRERASQPAASQQQLAQLRSAVVEATFPDPLEHALRDALEKFSGLLAVRSSGVSEDSASSSFAGQHDTLLGVAGLDAVRRAIKVCWSSLWSERAHHYRASREERELPSMAVVVQELIEPTAAGVLFTREPVTNDPERFIIDACWGFGEGVVSGKVTTDTFLVSKANPEDVQRRIRYKLHASRIGRNGHTELVKVPMAQREEPVLTQEHAVALALQARRLLERYGCDQDVEWAFRDKQLYLLQTRPLTQRAPQRSSVLDPNPAETGEQYRQGTLWSRMDVGEIFNGQMTPLGISFARYYQYRVHADCIRALGCRYLGDPARYMGYVQGHVYLNVSYSAYLLTQTPPNRDPRRFTERFSSEEVDLATYRNPYGVISDAEQLRLGSRFWTQATLRELMTMRHRARRMAASRLREYDRFRQLDLKRMDHAQLGRELGRDLEYFRQVHIGYMPYYINAFAFYGALEALCGAWLPKDGASLQNRLKSDMSNLRTVEAVREIQELAKASQRYDGLPRIICGTLPSEVERALLRSPEGRRFHANEYRAFMRQNGVRTRQEMELTNRCWVDDPTYVFQMMRRFYDNPEDVTAIAERGRSVRGEDTAGILKGLPPHKRAALGGVIRMYSLCSELREIVRMTMITSIWMIRSVVHEVGRRAVERGALNDLTELAYLDFFEIIDYTRRNTGEVCFARPALDARRREHLHFGRLPAPPLTFVGTYDPTRVEAAAKPTATLTGVGTSPGRVVGRARLMRDITEQAGELREGEIIVTTSTDASWTPLFLSAGAVVTDVGSMLSHSSIVAREFNIPAVVNTKVATAVVHTGDMLIVDGTTGQVEIQRPS